MMRWSLSIAITCLVCLAPLNHGSPVSREDYPADYYNDEEYYNDDTYNYDDSEEGEEAAGREGEQHEAVVRRNPKFISQPKKVMVNEGDTIKLPCLVDKIDNFVILWKKKTAAGKTILTVGDTVTGSEDGRTKVEANSNGNLLVISLAEAEDGGEYTCQLSALNTVELKHTVRVRVQPVVEPVPGTGVVVVEAGQPANLQCRLVKGSPEPEITWRRARRPLPGGEESLSGSSITFPRASRHHTGLYTCSADNGWGEPAIAQIKLDVQHKPEIEQEETFIHSRDGDEVEITCTIHASPAAEVEWYRNGQLLDPRNFVITQRGNRHSLLLQKIGKRDTHGKYQCRAVNTFGEAMALTEVSGKAAPAAFKSAKMGSKEDATSYSLEWVVTSSSEVSEFKVEYREAGEGAAWEDVTAKVERVGAESFAGAVLLEGLKEKQSYLARVAAKNSYGYSNYSPEFEFSTYDAVTLTARPTAEPSTGGVGTISSSLALTIVLLLLGSSQ